MNCCTFFKAKCRLRPWTLRSLSSHYVNQNPQEKCSHHRKAIKDFQDLKSFSDIPGPKPLPLLGNLWRYATGEYSFDQLHTTGLKKYKQFGPIVREEILPKINLLLLYRPEDIETMYKTEGRYPSRRSHQALEFYRLQRPHVYNTAGLLPTNGPEWYRLRQALQRPINIIENVRRYIPDVDSAAREFTEYVEKDILNGTSSLDFLDDLSKVFLEFLGLVLFDTRLEALNKNLDPDSCPARLMRAASDTNSQILRTDNGLQIWRKYPTRAYKILSEAQQYFEGVAIRFVSEKLSSMNSNIKYYSNNSSKTLLEEYLTSNDLDVKDVITMVSDMLLAGIETSSYSMSFIMYHLANNPEKQNIAAEEIQKILPNREQPVCPNVLAKMHYLKAVIKESFRLNPISIGVGRILPEDAVFSGYKIPKNTILVSQNQVSCKLEEYFKNADTFEPGRWIRDHPAYAKAHPYLVLPFGHGPRACIARRLAEQNMQVLLIRLLQRFRIGWQGGKLDSQSLLINRPNGPLKFSFTRRSS